MPKARKTKGRLDREIEEAIIGLDRRIESASIEGGELYWRGRKGSPVVKPHPRTSTNCKKCGQFHSTGEHRRHVRSSAGSSRLADARTGKTKKAKPRAARARIDDGRSTIPARRDPAEIVREAVLSAPPSDRFGKRKVFISRVWSKAKDELGMSLEEFKRWLVEAYMGRKLELSRADLVAAMDPELVAASETRPPGERFPEWHFIVDEQK